MPSPADSREDEMERRFPTGIGWRTMPVGNRRSIPNGFHTDGA